MVFLGAAAPSRSTPPPPRRSIRVVIVTASERNPPTPPQQARPAYEQARDELTEVVRRLEAGGLTLEQSLELWERGERLAAICAEWLEGARARLAAAMAQRTDEDGDAAAPF
jgi:exodeoxyribonuclease VII small subunit